MILESVNYNLKCYYIIFPWASRFSMRGNKGSNSDLSSRLYSLIKLMKCAKNEFQWASKDKWTNLSK